VLHLVVELRHVAEIGPVVQPWVIVDLRILGQFAGEPDGEWRGRIVGRDGDPGPPQEDAPALPDPLQPRSEEARLRVDDRWCCSRRRHVACSVAGASLFMLHEAGRLARAARRPPEYNPTDNLSPTSPTATAPLHVVRPVAAGPTTERAGLSPRPCSL